MAKMLALSGFSTPAKQTQPLPKCTRFWRARVGIRDLQRVGYQLSKLPGAFANLMPAAVKAHPAMI